MVIPMAEGMCVLMYTYEIINYYSRHFNFVWDTFGALLGGFAVCVIPVLSYMQIYRYFTVWLHEIPELFDYFEYLDFAYRYLSIITENMDVQWCSIQTRSQNLKISKV